MPQYKLYYFDVLGLAEPIRLCFAQAGVPFEDVRIKAEEWPQLKETMPFGQVPVLEVDGKKLTQSSTILRYIAKKHGLEADNEWDQALGDELATSWVDMTGHMMDIITESDPEVKRGIFEKFVEEFLTPRLTICNDRLSQSKSGFIAGDKVTWSDFSVYNLFTMVKDYFKVPLTPYPALEKFQAKIASLPNVKKWQEQHKSTPFSIAPSILELDYNKLKEMLKKK